MTFLELGHRSVRRVGFALHDTTTALRAVAGKPVTPYIGWVGYRNLGDEVIFQAHQKMFQGKALVHYWGTGNLTAIAAKLRKQPFRQAILGGGTLVDHGNIWLNQVMKLQQEGAELFCIGTGVEGPEHWRDEEGYHRHMKEWVTVLKRFCFVGVRGPISQRNLSRAGLTDVQIVGDSALALWQKSGDPAQEGTVGVCYGPLRDEANSEGQKNYEESITQIIRELIRKGHKVRLLPVWVEDIAANKILLEEINHESCELIEAFDSFESYGHEVSKCHVFVGQKLHASVIALMGGVPAIMVEYLPKCRDFMESIGLEQYVVQTKNLTPNGFFPLFEKLLREHSSIRDQAAEKINFYKQIQLNRAKQLTSLM